MFGICSLFSNRSSRLSGGLKSPAVLTRLPFWSGFDGFFLFFDNLLALSSAPGFGFFVASRPSSFFPLVFCLLLAACALFTARVVLLRLWLAKVVSPSIAL